MSPIYGIEPGRPFREDDTWLMHASHSLADLLMKDVREILPRLDAAFDIHK